MNWVDVTIIGLVAIGICFGAKRGVLRQIAVMAAFYVSLVFAAQFYGPAAMMIVERVPRADLSVASAYTLAGITAAGTLCLVWLFHQVYGTTALPRVQLLDRLGGAGLGAAWSWAVAAFAITVVIYGLSISWGGQEPTRAELSRAVSHSTLVGLLRASLPELREYLSPWLPGGLPAPLSF